MGSRPVAVLVCLSALLSPVAAQQPDTAVTKTTLDGSYSPAQARSGAAIFQKTCGDCHAAAQFQDATFLTGWSGRSVRDLFESVRTQMPQDNPGSLTRQEYADVLAYIFELNGMPPGETPLRADEASLRRVRIQTKGSAP